MNSKQQHKHIVTELIESTVRQDNEVLCAMNRELITRLEEARATIEQQRDSLRRTRSINRLQAMNITNLQDTIHAQETRITDHENWDGIHYAVMREYLINNPEARDRWDNHVSFHDEIYEAAVLDHDVLGINYNGLNEVATDNEDDEVDPILDAIMREQEEEDDIRDNWL